MPSAWRLPARHHCQGRRRPRLPRAAKALGGRAHPRLALSKPPSLQGLRTSARRQRSLRQTRDDPPHDRSIDMNHTSKTDSEGTEGTENPRNSTIINLSRARARAAGLFNSGETGLLSVDCLKAVHTSVHAAPAALRSE